MMKTQLFWILKFDKELTVANGSGEVERSLYHNCIENSQSVSEEILNVGLYSQKLWPKSIVPLFSEH